MASISFWRGVINIWWKVAVKIKPKGIFRCWKNEERVILNVFVVKKRTAVFSISPHSPSPFLHSLQTFRSNIDRRSRSQRTRLFRSLMCIQHTRRYRIYNGMQGYTGYTGVYKGIQDCTGVYKSMYRYTVFRYIQRVLRVYSSLPRSRF